MREPPPQPSLATREREQIARVIGVSRHVVAFPLPHSGEGEGGGLPREGLQSRAVFSTVTPRKRAAGAPWETGASCIGSALPQVKVPQSR